MDLKERDSNPNNADCLSCRLISGLGFVGIGSYIFLNAKHFKGLNRHGMYTVSACFAGIGLARLFKLGPFNKESISSSDSQN